jgi:hypothetical protein
MEGRREMKADEGERVTGGKNEKKVSESINPDDVVRDD